MKKTVKKSSSKETSKKINVKFDPKDNVVFQSTIKTFKGNQSTFKVIFDKNEPDFKQTVEE